MLEDDLDGSGEEVRDHGLAVGLTEPREAEAATEHSDCHDTLEITPDTTRQPRSVSE